MFTGLCITVVSEIYWNLFYDGLRISLSVVLFPVLIMTMDLETNTLWTGITSGGMIFVFRSAAAYVSGAGVIPAIQSALPGGLYYLFYSLLFFFLVQNKYMARFPRLIISVLCCDFISNMFENFLRNGFPIQKRRVFELLSVAVVRTILVGFILLLIERYRFLLTKKEHEQRYQRLFLMTAGLKNEIYFMKKNTEEIEEIMSNSYRLYEALSNQQVKLQTKEWALMIARDVHEIKKDYICIIRGLEQEVRNQYPEKEMWFSDILTILRDATYRMIESKHLNISLNFQYQHDFLTQAHYSVMLLLKNLVNNSVEAIALSEEKNHRKHRVDITEQLAGQTYQISVSDDGPGISEKNIPKIFQHGFSTKFDLENGNMFRGVGLSGVRSTVEEQFHGTIRVESQPNVKTEFHMDIPASALERGLR